MMLFDEKKKSWRLMLELLQISLQILNFTLCSFEKKSVFFKKKPIIPSFQLFYDEGYPYAGNRFVTKIWKWRWSIKLKKYVYCLSHLIKIWCFSSNCLFFAVLRYPTQSIYFIKEMKYRFCKTWRDNTFFENEFENYQNLG